MIRFHAFMEVGYDGTIAVAIQLAVNEPEMDDQERMLHANLPDEANQNDVEYALIVAFNFATQLENSLNPSSDSQLQARIVAHENDPIIIRKNEGGWAGSFLRPREESTPIKIFRTITQVFHAGSSDAEDHEALIDLILEVMNQAGIETIHILQQLQEPEETP